MWVLLRHDSFLNSIVDIFIVSSFLLNFKLKLVLWSDVWKSQGTLFHRHLSLLTSRSNPPSWHLSFRQYSFSLAPCLHSHSCFLSEVRLQQCNLLCTWRNLLAYPSWFLEIQWKLSTLMLIKQKIPLRWGWLLEQMCINSQKAPWWHFHTQSFCLQPHFYHHVSVVTRLLTPQKSSSVILSLLTSPIISAHSTVKNTVSYKWSGHRSWTS